MNENLSTVIEAVAKERGLEKDILIHAMEASVAKAAQKSFGESREIDVKFEETTGEIELYQYMMVVDNVINPEKEISVSDLKTYNLSADVGEELGFQIFWKDQDAAKAIEQDKQFGSFLNLKKGRTSFGRIAIQAAKQVLFQKVFDAEKEIIFNEFNNRKNTLIKGFVKKFERGNIIVDLGKTEGVLSYREQIPRESYRPGEQIIAYVKDLQREGRLPKVILSRADSRLVERMFEIEVPEIYEGIVKIMGIAREPGTRTKIAVYSRDPDLDPVEVCIGSKGTRVHAILYELSGEKIDIIQYYDNPITYILSALQTDNVLNYTVNDAEKKIKLVVPDAKVAITLGKGLLNVKLASQLTGWKIEVIAESKVQLPTPN